MAPSFINAHYTTIFLVLLFGIKLHAQRESRNIDMRYYWLTLFCCALLVVQDQLETVASLNKMSLIPRRWRGERNKQ